MSVSSRRVLPVVRWLQLGAAAAGVGVAFGLASAAATPATAWADDGETSSASEAPRAQGRTSDGAADSAADSTARRTVRAHATVEGATAGARQRTAPSAAAAARTPSVRVPAPSSVTDGSPAAVSLDTPSKVAVPVASATIDTPFPILSAPPASPTVSIGLCCRSAAPSLGFLPTLARLTLEDVFTGTGPAAVTNPAAVVTGLFNQVLRRNPTAAELQNYVTLLGVTGANGVISGLYTSLEFRQNAVTSYYVELLGQTPTQQQLDMGVFQYMLGGSERFVASLAGSPTTYTYSASGGGPYGSKPSPTSYVNLLYRSLLGESADSTATPLIQSIEQGMPISRAANQFVTSDIYRTVKVGEIYEVLGQQASPTDIAGYVSNWFWNGGQSGISQSLLATTANTARIEAGLVQLPDVQSAALLQNIMLSAYGKFVEGLKKELQGGGSEDVGKENGCKGTVDNSECNVAFYTLLSTGGTDRGIPNNALQTSTGFVQTTTLIPTQNEVDIDQSLQYPLRDPTTTAQYLKGGPVTPFGIILTADNGTYVIDGHHRWSALYVMNPYTSIASIDLGYVPTPQDALKETQMAIAAREGYLPFKVVEGSNLFTVDEQVFKAKVFEYIWAAILPDAPKSLINRQDDLNPSSDGYLRPKVFNEFMNFLYGDDELPDVPQGALNFDQAVKYTQPIQDYLWANVLRMRQYNQPIPGATPRSDMPQPIGNAYPPLLQLLDTGEVIYTLPSISLLG